MRLYRAGQGSFSGLVSRLRRNLFLLRRSLAEPCWVTIVEPFAFVVGWEKEGEARSVEA